MSVYGGTSVPSFPPFLPHQITVISWQTGSASVPPSVRVLTRDLEIHDRNLRVHVRMIQSIAIELY